MKKLLFLILFLYTSLFGFSQVKVPVVKIENLLQRIENNNDTLYIVNFWATWCKPCVAELPDFEKINLEYKGQKIKVLLVTLDFKEELEKRVLPFIHKNNFTSEFMLLDETGGSFIDKIHLDWSGAIPATLLIKNNKKHFIGKKTNYEELKSRIISSQ